MKFAEECVLCTKKHGGYGFATTNHLAKIVHVVETHKQVQGAQVSKEGYADN